MNVLKICITFAKKNIMPNTKGSDIRYKILDRCLRKGGYSTQRLMQEVNKYLEDNGYPTISASNTIRQDLDYISANYPQVAIEEKRIGRNITYGYKKTDSSIFQLSFNDDELAQLSQCMAILSRFGGTPQSDWIKKFVERFQLSLQIETDCSKVVGFDWNRQLKGREFFTKLLSAIVKGTVLHIKYKSFKRTAAKMYVVHPYFLKEYNNRWFLLGWGDDKDALITLSLDRIISLKELPEKTLRPNESINFSDEYFEDIIGITKKDDSVLTKIRLWISPQLSPYIKTKPIHNSQIIKSEDERGMIIELYLYPNFEMEQEFLSHGEGLKVISPDSVRNRILERLKATLDNY